MSNEDPVETYGRANPVPEVAKPSVTDPAAQALLKEITMSTTQTPLRSASDNPEATSTNRGLDRFGRRPGRFAIAAAAAVAVLGGFGLALAGPGSTDVALADVLLTSARQTEAVSSGSISTEVIQEAASLGSMSITIEQVFDGDDSALSFMTEGVGGFGQETISIDGTVYERVPGGDWTALPGDIEPPEIATAPEVVEFVSAAESVEDCDVEGDDVTSYCIATDDLDMLNTILPIDFEASDGITSADVRIDVDSESGLITDVVVDAEATTPDGVDGTIAATVSYRELGQRQQIEAPDLG